MRPTPETDARWMYPASFDSNEKVVQISVAQKLERERDEAREALQRLANCPDCPIDVQLESTEQPPNKEANK